MKNLSTHFYQELGKLFFAIAAADNDVREAEINKLHKIVKSKWLLVDEIEDEFHTDAAYQIEVVFDWLNNQDDLNAEACFNDFVDFKNDQKHFFTDSIKKLIIKTANEIANSFSGKNKSELIMLAKLDIELKKI
ncbi:hypothetical protein [Formosa maritima]|uniref:TerB family tellurite resistance protein n=1 Tax=Formosa maritima TaxID=2592046 RepID=A0A5D0GGE4_9FLAO|nr:hypothetical protein [Formosa maritima]TYA58048.1 hypothetical protein FVF61_04340 [Formosa maritima]